MVYVFMYKGNMVHVLRVLWTVIILRYAQDGFSKKALETFR